MPRLPPTTSAIFFVLFVINAYARTFPVPVCSQKMLHNQHPIRAAKTRVTVYI